MFDGGMFVNSGIERENFLFSEGLDCPSVLTNILSSKYLALFSSS